MRLFSRIITCLFKFKIQILFWFWNFTYEIIIKISWNTLWGRKDDKVMEKWIMQQQNGICKERIKLFLCARTQYVYIFKLRMWIRFRFTKLPLEIMNNFFKTFFGREERLLKSNNNSLSSPMFTSPKDFFHRFILRKKYFSKLKRKKQ